MAKAKPMKTASTSGRSVATFRAAHNRNVVIPNKIRAALAKMEADHGPEHYEYESDFIKLAGIGGSDLNGHRDAFVAHIVEAKPIGMGNSRGVRRAWFATVKAAKAASGE